MNKQYNLEELLDLLIGHTDIACETNYDNDSFENLYTLEHAVCYLAGKLYNNVDYYNDYRGSANRIAHRSMDIAKELKEFVDDMINKEKMGE